jgi:hypothetical protein
MKYEQIKDLPEEQFRRLTGVMKETFNRLVEILRKEEKIKKRKGGRNNKLSIEDRLLMTLEYLREYRTYFHIGQSYGISESSAYKNIKWVEDTLIKHPDLHLPGKKKLQNSDMEYEVILVDSTESPIERPKKNRRNTTQVKRRNTQ